MCGKSITMRAIHNRFDLTGTHIYTNKIQSMVFVCEHTVGRCFVCQKKNSFVEFMFNPVFACYISELARFNLHYKWLLSNGPRTSHISISYTLHWPPEHKSVNNQRETATRRKITWIFSQAREYANAAQQTHTPDKQ